MFHQNPCHFCKFYSGAPDFPCAVRPSGPGGKDCPDQEIKESVAKILGDSKLITQAEPLPFYVPEQLCRERMQSQGKVGEDFELMEIFKLMEIDLFSKPQADTPEIIRAADAVMRAKGFVRVDREDFADLAKSFACPVTIVDESMGTAIVVEYYSVGIAEKLEIDIPAEF